MRKWKERMEERPVAAAVEAACQGNGKEPLASIWVCVHVSFAIAIAIPFAIAIAIAKFTF